MGHKNKRPIPTGQLLIPIKRQGIPFVSSVKRQFTYPKRAGRSAEKNDKAMLSTTLIIPTMMDIFAHLAAFSAASTASCCLPSSHKEFTLAALIMPGRPRGQHKITPTIAFPKELSGLSILLSLNSCRAQHFNN